MSTAVSSSNDDHNPADTPPVHMSIPAAGRSVMTGALRGAPKVIPRSSRICEHCNTRGCKGKKVQRCFGGCGSNLHTKKAGVSFGNSGNIAGKKAVDTRDSRDGGFAADRLLAEMCGYTLDTD